MAHNVGGRDDQRWGSCCYLKKESSVPGERRLPADGPLTQIRWPVLCLPHPRNPGEEAVLEGDAWE